MDNNINCRGHEQRKIICQEYILRPLTFTVLLSNQQKYSCASHSMLKDRYYTFEYESRLNANDKGTFFVGESSGRDFINILKSYGNVYEPPLFNPLKIINKNINKINSNTVDTTNTDIFKMTELNKEVYIAINLLCMIWDTIPFGNIQSILEFCATAKVNTQDWSIKSINNLIGKDYYNRTLYQMIKELDYSNKIKQYDFKLITKIIDKNGWKNNIK